MRKQKITYVGKSLIRLRYPLKSILSILVVLVTTISVFAVAENPAAAVYPETTAYKPEHYMVEFQPAEGERLNDPVSYAAQEILIPVENLDADDPEDPEEETESFVSLGVFCLTAYCGCPECCGEYGENRPLDENGNAIVVGAVGIPLEAGVSIAADPSVIALGSTVYIDGQPYTVHDTGGAIEGNRIDVYFADHAEALAFGVRYAEIFVEV